MAPPDAPSNLDGSFNPDDTITLTWTDNADNEDGYRVFESTDGGSSFTNISGDLPSDTETFTTGIRDRDLGYVYFVEAFNVDGTAQSVENTVIDEGYAVDDETDRFSEEPTPQPPAAVEEGAGGGPIEKNTGYIIDEVNDRITEAAPQSPPAAVEDGAGGGPIEKETGYLVDEVVNRFTEAVPQPTPQAVEEGAGGEAIEPASGYLGDEITDRFSTWPPAEEGMQPPPQAVLGVAGGFSSGGAATFGLVPGLAAMGGGKQGTIGIGFTG